MFFNVLSTEKIVEKNLKGNLDLENRHFKTKLVFFCYLSLKVHIFMFFLCSEYKKKIVKRNPGGILDHKMTIYLLPIAQ